MEDRDNNIYEILNLLYGCKICNGILVDVTYTDCGHRFCNSCIKLFQKYVHDCPHCNKKFKKTSLMTNVDVEIQNIVCTGSFQLQEWYRSKQNSKRTSQPCENSPKDGIKNVKGTTESTARSKKLIDGIFQLLNNENPPPPENSRAFDAGENSMKITKKNYVETTEGRISLAEELIAVYDRLQRDVMIANERDQIISQELTMGPQGDNKGLALPNIQASSSQLQSGSIPNINLPSSFVPECRFKLKKKQKYEINSLMTELDKIYHVDSFLRKWNMALLGNFDSAENMESNQSKINSGKNKLKSNAQEKSLQTFKMKLTKDDEIYIEQHKTLVRDATALAMRHFACHRNRGKKQESNIKAVLPFSTEVGINLTSIIPKGDFDSELKFVQLCLDDHQARSAMKNKSARVSRVVGQVQNQTEDNICSSLVPLTEATPAIKPDFSVDLWKKLEESTTEWERKFCETLIIYKDALKRVSKLTNPEAIRKLVPYTAEAIGDARPEVRIEQ